MSAAALEAENRALKQRVQQLEADLAAAPPKWDLELAEYTRYGRQLIMPEIGLEGQLRLKRARVLVVGVGGLGCPAAAYLAGAGVGTIGLMDHDTVEASNLHRQILHSTAGVGTAKVESAVVSLRRLNPHPKYVPHAYALSPSNAADVLRNYDLVLDCTDHPSLRYLISDTAVLGGIPIVSASALRNDGQLIVLNSPPGEGPCYRCIWPRPPPAPTSCADGGILGPVVGTMGVLQALEAIKLLVRGAGPVTMTLFSAWPQLAFRHCRMRARRRGCPGCGGTAPATDYAVLCAPTAVLAPEERVAADEYRELRARGAEHVLLDVRDQTQYALCHLHGSWNVPFEEFQRAAAAAAAAEAAVLPDRVRDRLYGARAVYVMCRLGNDSQVVARTLKTAGVAEGRVWDVKGGIREWARTAPEGFPEY